MAPTRTSTSERINHEVDTLGLCQDSGLGRAPVGAFPPVPVEGLCQGSSWLSRFSAERVSETLLRKSSERDLQGPGAMAELDQVQAATGPEEPAVATGHDQGLARVGASDGGSGEVASMKVDRHAEVDLRALAADLGDQPAARLSAHTPTVTVGEDVAEGGVVPGAEVAFVLGKRRDVDDVVRAELDAEPKHVQVVVGNGRGGAAGGDGVSGHGEDAGGGQRRGCCGCAEPQAGGGVVHEGAFLVLCGCSSMWFHRSSLPSVTRAATRATRLAQPTRTAAARAGGRRALWSVAVVRETAAPVGSHLASDGNSGFSTASSITAAHTNAPMMAATVLRVSAPSATPSSPKQAVSSVVPTQSDETFTGRLWTPREAYTGKAMARSKPKTAAPPTPPTSAAVTSFTTSTRPLLGSAR